VAEKSEKKKDMSPRMLYKFPGKKTKLQDGIYETVIVPECEAEKCVKDGWFTTPWDAKAAFEKKPEKTGKE